MDKRNLYGWVFIFNSFTNKYYGARREDWNLLFSDVKKGLKSGKVLSSSEMTTLEYIICKTDGNPERIDKLLNNYK